MIPHIAVLVDRATAQPERVRLQTQVSGMEQQAGNVSAAIGCRVGRRCGRCRAPFAKQ